MTKKWKMIWGIILVLTLGFGIYKWKFGTNLTTTYQTTTVERGELIISVSGSGQVAAANVASISTAAGGVVKRIYVQNAQIVYSGQPIAEIDLDQDSRQKYSSALAAYESALANLHSLQVTLFSTNQKLINDAVARGLSAGDPTYIQENAAWLAAEITYKNQQNSINSAWTSMRQASPIIYSPIAGTVTGLSLQEGSVITGAQKIASVKTNAVPTVSINLTEIDVPKVKIGNPATITLSAFAGKTFTGKVVSVDTVGSISSGVTVYPAIIKLNTTNLDVLPNMSATANIISQTKSGVLMVPISSLQNGQVKIMKNGTPSPITVETGLVSDTQIEIISGVAEGDTIVTGIINSGSTTSTTRSVFSGNAFRVGGR